MFHTLAFTASATAGGTDVDIPAVYDGYASLQNNHYLLPKDMQVMAAYAQGATITGAKISVPSLRYPALPEVVPVNQAASYGSLAPFCIEPPGMYNILKTDEVAFLTSNTAGAAERHITGLWVGDGNLNIPRGNIITVRFTASITTGNLIWGAGAITLAQGLPVGRYSVVGLDIIGANLIFGRIVFPDRTNKPGIPCRQSLATNPWNYFRYGNFGEFGQFDTVSLPGIEVFGSAAPTTQTGFLDLVKIA